MPDERVGNSDDNLLSFIWTRASRELRVSKTGAQLLFSFQDVDDVILGIDNRLYTLCPEGLFSWPLRASVHQNERQTVEIVENRFSVGAGRDTQYYQLSEGRNPEIVPIVQLFRLPPEPVATIVGHVLNCTDPSVELAPRLLSSPLFRSCRTLEGEGLAWISRQTWTLTLWPFKTMFKLLKDEKIVWLLQSAKHFRISLAGIPREELENINDVFRQLLSIWDKKHRLESLVLLVQPDLKHLVTVKESLRPEPKITECLDPILKTLGKGVVVLWDARDFFGEWLVVTPIFEAVDSGNCDLLKFMLDQNISASRYETGALCRAAQSESSEFLAQLLRVDGIDVNATAYDGTTPMDLAVVQGRNENIRLLVEHGAILRHPLFSYSDLARDVGFPETAELIDRLSSTAQHC